MIAFLSSFPRVNLLFFVCILAEAWRGVRCTTNDFTIDMYHDAVPRYINITMVTISSMHLAFQASVLTKKITYI
jgi:hypothetical protein